MLGQSLAPTIVGAALPALAFAAVHGQGAYRAMRRRILIGGAGMAVVLGAVGLLAAPAIIATTAPGFDDAMLADATGAFRVFCIYILLVGLTFGPRVVLSLHDVLWPGAVASLVVSLGLVGGAVLGGTLTSLAWSGTAAGAILLSLHLLAQRKLPSETPHVGEEAGEARPPLLLPVAGLLLYQVASASTRFLDRGLASTMPDGSIAALDYSYAILTGPAILLGTSFVMVAFPPFTRAVARGAAWQAARRGALPFLGLLAAGVVVGTVFHFFALPFVNLLLSHGAFDSEAAEQTSRILSWHALGFPLAVTTMVLAQGLMAMRKVGWLLAAGLARAGVRILALDRYADGEDIVGLGQAYLATEVVTSILLVTLFLLALRRQPNRG